MKFYIAHVETRNGWGGKVRYRCLVSGRSEAEARRVVEAEFGSKVKLSLSQLTSKCAVSEIMMQQCIDSMAL